VRPREDVLSSIQGAPKRKKFITVDIESKAGDTQEAGFTRPFLVGIYDGVNYVEFRNEPHIDKRHWKRRHFLPGGCIDKALNYILSDRYRGYQVYAHNGGSFDHLFWLAWLKRNLDEYSFEVVPVQSSIQKITVTRRQDENLNKRKKAKCSWTFLDSMKLFPSSLDKMLQTFKLEGKVRHDLSMHESDPRWSIYLRQDCVGLYEALVQFHELIENRLGGEVGMTAPSTAMKLFRRRFLGRGEVPDNIPRHAHFPGCKDRFKKKLEPKDCIGCCHEFIRRAYYGGRTEPFRMRGTGLHYYDLNSSYVAAMREAMPAGHRIIEDNPKSIDWKRHENFVGFAECDVQIPEDCYIPPLPHRAPSGKLIFPTGRFRGVWDLDELKLLDHPRVQGRVLKVHKVVWFKKVFLFRDMVSDLWKLRDTSRKDFDESMSQLAKLMGNSTYGKFGQKRERTQISFRREEATAEECFLCLKPATRSGLCDECEGSKPATGDPEDDVWYQRKRVDAPYIIPQIPAHIATLARIALWRYMVMALDLGGRLYYSDTDSIITDVILPSSKELGALKDEYPGHELDGIFIQPKVYMIEESEASWMRRDPNVWRADPNLDASTLDGALPRLKEKVTMKGFPRDVRTKASLKKLQRGETVAFSRLEKVRSLARTRFWHAPDMIEVKKSFRTEYDKRVLLADGVETRARVVDELELELAIEEAAE
jgi:hypothetical protein